MNGGYSSDLTITFGGVRTPVWAAIVLIGLIAVPLLGALAAVLLRDRTGRLVGTATAGLTLLGALALLAGRHHFGWLPATVDMPGIVPWYQVDLPWVPALDLRFHLGVDGLSWPLVALTALLTVLCCGYTIRHEPATSLGIPPAAREGDRRDSEAGRPAGNRLVALLLVLEAGIVGVFLSLDLVLFFVFFEVVLLPMYAVIVGWGGERRRPAAVKFVLYTLFGSVLLLVGVFVVVAEAGTADLTALTGGAGLPAGTQLAAFGLLALAFAVKSPLWPLHTWLPDAHTEAPTVGSVVLAGVMLKLGTYGLIRVAVGVAPDGARRLAPLLGALAVAAILVGSLACLAQRELKRLIAYSSVSHMGFVLLGVATLTATGLQAAVIGNIAHGLITGLLFFLAGAVKDRAHTGELVRLGGLRNTAPRLAGVLGFAAIASLGLPGLAGFWGEAFAVVAAYRRGWLLAAVLAAVGGAITAAYFLRLLRRVTHGPTAPALAEAPEPHRYEWLAWAPLVALTVAVGLAPLLVLGLSEDPVGLLLQAVHR